jgi:hypothetical protein
MLPYKPEVLYRENNFYFYFYFYYTAMWRKFVFHKRLNKYQEYEYKKELSGLVCDSYS